MSIQQHKQGATLQSLTEGALGGVGEAVSGLGYSGVELRSAITKATLSAGTVKGKMIKYKAVERKINVLVCVDGRWQWPAGPQKCELRSAAKVVGRARLKKWSSCAKWLVVLRQKCVFQQEM